jgi:hypothetical protein
MPRDGYEPVPTSSAPNTNSWSIPKWVPRHVWLRPRQAVTALATVALLLTFVSFFHLGELNLFAHPEEALWASNATNFDEIFLREAQLPQHNLLAPYPEGENGRFLRFSNQVWGLG